MRKKGSRTPAKNSYSYVRPSYMNNHTNNDLDIGFIRTTLGIKERTFRRRDQSTVGTALKRTFGELKRKKNSEASKLAEFFQFKDTPEENISNFGCNILYNI